MPDDLGTDYGNDHLLDTCGVCGCMEYEMYYDNQKDMYACEDCIEEDA